MSNLYQPEINQTRRLINRTHRSIRRRTLPLPHGLRLLRSLTHSITALNLAQSLQPLSRPPAPTPPTVSHQSPVLPLTAPLSPYDSDRLWCFIPTPITPPPPHSSPQNPS